MTSDNPADRAARPQNRRTILLLSLGHFANDAYPGFLAPLQPLLMQQAHYSLTLAGVLTSIASISGSIMQPLFGLWSDRMRRPWLVICGPLVTALLFGTIGWWHSWYALAAIVLLGGLGTAAFHPQAAAISGKAGQRRSGLAMSLFVTGGNAGHAMGPLIILSVVALWGLRYSMVTAVLGVAVALLLWKQLPRTITPGESDGKRHVPWSKQERRRLGSLALIWLVVVLRSFIVSGFMTFCPIYLTGKGYSLLMAGSANTLFEISGAFGSILGGALSDRIGRKEVIVLSMAGAFPAFWLFLHGGSLLAPIMLAIAGFFIYSSISVNIVMGQALFPRQAGTISSLMMGMGWGIGGLAVTPLGALAEKYGVSSALNGLIFTTLAGLLAALLIRPGKPEQPREVSGE
ncbi:MAG TPA: MFS transporter [bacterium]|nr:MFS transporter [bacterium]HPR88448.1 MFS transporter [bacterium]